MSLRGGYTDDRYGSSPPRGYTTVKRYTIPRDSDERVSTYGSDRSVRGSETRIVRRERDSTPDRQYAREYRYERDVERPRDDYQLDRYTKTTEYYPQAPRAPVVVPQEQDYQIVRHSEVYDNRVAHREPSEDEYYYERRVQKVEEASPERKERRRRRSHSRHYSSDDDMVYVKKTVREGRSISPHRRHLAEGAIAGVGVAELIRHHRAKSGDEASSRSGRIGRDLAAAGAGAVGAEVISRVRNSRSKSRHGSRDRDGRHRHRRHSDNRSRSGSRGRVKTLAGIGLGVAALAAAAGYAKHRSNENKGEDRRSRSRTRRHSVSGAPEESKKNTRMAQAGVAGAAVAGLIERARSKSRTRDGHSRSHSRIKTGIPIAAAGLGSAAIAGLFEKNKENKRDQKRLEEEKAADRERRRSRSRSRQASVYSGPPMASMSTPGLIEYGDGAIYSNGGVPDYYNRPVSQAGYYPPEPVPTRVVETREVRSMSRDGDRRRDYSSDSDDGHRRHHRRRRSGDKPRSRSRSQSRTRELATAGLAAGAAAIGATQFAKRQERKRAELEKDRKSSVSCHQPGNTNLLPGLDAEARDNERDYPQSSPSYASQYSPLSPGAPPHVIEQGYPPESYYPNSNAFPPPPGATFSPHNAAYNPADYANAPPQGYAPAGGVYSPPPDPAYAGRRRGDENVSPGYAPDPLRNAEEGG